MCQTRKSVHATIRQRCRSSSMLTRNPKPPLAQKTNKNHPVRPLLAGCRGAHKLLPLQVKMSFPPNFGTVFILVSVASVKLLPMLTLTAQTD